MLKFKRRDIAGGDFSYGERIMLARIFADEKLTDYRRIQEVIKCLHDVEISPKEAAKQLDYVIEIQEAFFVWLKREKEMFYIPPTEEETRAGIDQLTKDCGDMGLVVSLARDFHFTFEQVYKMPYLDVFTIQKVDVARAKYERRLSDVYLKKSKSKTK